MFTDYNKVLTLEDIMDDTSVPPPSIIENGILLEETILCLIGPAKAGKTFLSLNFAAALASGKSFANFKITNKKKVLVLCSEGGYYPNRNRIQIICQQIDKDCYQNFNFIKNLILSLDDTSGIHDFETILKSSKPDVVIIDPLIRFHQADENSSNNIIQVFKTIRRLMAKYNFATIVIHHTGKQVSLGGRGSSVITGEYDSAIMMHPNKENDTLRLRYDMRHVKTPDSNQISFDDTTFWFENVANNYDIVTDYIKKLGPITRAKLVKTWMFEDKYSNSNGYKVIKKAEDKGLIQEDFNDKKLYLVSYKES